MGRFATAPGFKRRRAFPVARVTDGDGKSAFGARITCGECGDYSDHPGRGDIDNEVYFERHGWFVGKNEKRDRCPRCRRKAVRNSPAKVVSHQSDAPNFAYPKVEDMTEAKQAQPSREVSREMSREDGRLLSRAIEDHWEDTSACYKLGWSDQRIAADMSVSVDWVKTIRERDFGGSGDEPGLAAFIAEQVVIKREIGELSTLLNMNEKDLQSGTMFQHELARKMEGYRNGHRRLLERIEKMDGIAAELRNQSAQRGR